jgi:hypothetical protein
MLGEGLYDVCYINISFNGKHIKGESYLKFSAIGLREGKIVICNKAVIVTIYEFLNYIANIEQAGPTVKLYPYTDKEKLYDKHNEILNYKLSFLFENGSENYAKYSNER